MLIIHNTAQIVSQPKKKNIRKKVFKIDSTPMIYFSVSNFNLLITKLFSAT